jgi:hypothetical protein
MGYEIGSSQQFGCRIATASPSAGAFLPSSTSSALHGIFLGGTLPPFLLLLLLLEMMEFFLSFLLINCR